MSIDHTVGTECFLDSVSPSTQYAVVFEEDGATGYFYALDTSLSGQQIVNAVHVYNVGEGQRAGEVVHLEVVWSADGLRAGLKRNDQLAAALDFSSSTGWQHGKPHAANGAWRTVAWDTKVDSWFG